MKDSATHTLRLERRFGHAVDKVWRAISQPAHLSAWWPMQIDELPLELGATLHFRDETGATSLGTITALTPGRALGFRDEAGEHEVHMELTPDGDGCRLVFTHTFTAGRPEQRQAGWNRCLDGLGEVLDFRPGPPGEATVREDDGRWTLVFVRELAHPREKVWTALTDPAQLRQWSPFDADARVSRAEPPSLLEHTWGDDHLRWELEPTAGGTRLTLRHTLDDRGMLSKVAAGWHLCVEVLDRWLGGRPVGLIVGDDAHGYGWHDLNHAYAARFGAAG